MNDVWLCECDTRRLFPQHVSVQPKQAKAKENGFAGHDTIDRTYSDSENDNAPLQTCVCVCVRMYTRPIPLYYHIAICVQQKTKGVQTRGFDIQTEDSLSGGYGNSKAHPAERDRAVAQLGTCQERTRQTQKHIRQKGTRPSHHERC